MLSHLKMPSSYTPSQKGAIAQFVGFTQVKDSVAAKVGFGCPYVEQQNPLLASGVKIPSEPCYRAKHKLIPYVRKAIKEPWLERRAGR